MTEHYEHMEGFLKSPPKFTFLPTPKPDTAHTPPSVWFADTATQDLLAVMDACLHNLYDVPRAKSIFDRLRQQSNNAVLEHRIYNAFIEAYVNMATSQADENKEYWLETAWELYNLMETEKDRIAPTPATYAV
ncbi:hypothetical protein MPER_06951, partial [Moniliophthora perniciosa FA553]